MRCMALRVKLPVVIKTFVLSFLSGRFTQILLYMYIPIRTLQISNAYL